MIDVKLMEKADGKIVNLYFKDGTEWKNKQCTNFYIKDDDDEENMLEFGNIIVNQSEIENIEILD